MGATSPTMEVFVESMIELAIFSPLPLMCGGFDDVDVNTGCSSSFSRDEPLGELMLPIEEESTIEREKRR